MDSKIILRLILIIFFISTPLKAIEFKGKFLQGHYIIGLTDPSAKILVGKKEVKVSKDGFFVFGIDRDRKFDLIITKIKDGNNEVILSVYKNLPHVWQIFGFLPEAKQALKEIAYFLKN